MACGWPVPCHTVTQQMPGRNNCLSTGGSRCTCVGCSRWRLKAKRRPGSPRWQIAAAGAGKNGCPSAETARAAAALAPRQILAALSNPVYVGQIHDGDRTRPGSHRAIVSVELFQQVASLNHSIATIAAAGSSEGKSLVAAARITGVRPIWPVDESQPIGTRPHRLLLLPLPLSRRWSSALCQRFPSGRPDRTVRAGYVSSPRPSTNEKC